MATTSDGLGIAKEVTHCYIPVKLEPVYQCVFPAYIQLMPQNVLSHPSQAAFARGPSISYSEKRTMSIIYSSFTMLILVHLQIFGQFCLQNFECCNGRCRPYESLLWPANQIADNMQLWHLFFQEIVGR